ncbi:hypothetical protein B0A52_05196 [Exophiala mesophila]|uniref:SET domain-containing protein n=1 Tax=Exophiala mesophila TaxID=212818 RepID=A0A438N487_EXOME|nr:hypothetical protein B0A52_05196 [Exophiala mesophila]
MASSTSLSIPDETLTNLISYLKAHKITHSPALYFRRMPGRGIGVFTKGSIPAGTRIFHVPTAALFTTSSIPFSFASKDLRFKIPVHALLAAYLTFGITQERAKQMHGWTATWPTWDDFSGSMPVFWPPSTRKEVFIESSPGAESAGAAKQLHFFALPPTLTGTQNSPADSMSTGHSSYVPLLDAQLAKLRGHIENTATLFPGHSTSLRDPQSAIHKAYLYNWANINTRCFYHVAAGKRPPKDSNEAMALCPGMDLFNHSDSATCHTSYDRKGFYVTTRVDVAPDSELLLSYGAHGNDLLWSEYGFVMDPNRDDHVPFDHVVLATLSPSDKKALSDTGYLGNYTLNSSGICWRTEVVSWLGILTWTQWHRFLQGKLDPQALDRAFSDNVHPGAGKRRKGNQGHVAPDKNSSVDELMPSTKVKKRQIAWLAEITRRAEDSINGLLILSDPSFHDQMMRIFSEQQSTSAHGRGTGANVQKGTTTIEMARLRLCITRWMQILEMSHKAVLHLYSTLPGQNVEASAASLKMELLRQRYHEVMQHD